MSEISTLDIYVIYTKGINGISMEDDVYTSFEEAEREANIAQEKMREIEKKYIQNDRMLTKFYVTSLYEFLIEYRDEMKDERERELREAGALAI
jgi:hypothetical protein